jgi:septal ring factor EnvC (AmiA/AmiB activator)
MLIALLIAYFATHFGGGLASPLLGDPARLETAIKHHVSDPARLAQLKALISEVKQADKESHKQQKTAAKAIEQVAARQATTADEFESAVEMLEARQRAGRDRQLALRLRLAALTTPEEWRAIFGEVVPERPAAGTETR